VKLFILCNPHNPGGRVWKQEELYQIGLICQKHQVLVISDEIHQDLVFAPHVFTTYHNVDTTFKEHSIILTSATKTFNLAGIKQSMVFIKNPDLRQRFKTIQKQLCQNEINTFGMIGTQAAYQHGEQWLMDLLAYIEKNIQFTLNFLDQHLPNIYYMKPEATYLIWLDFSAYQLTNSQLNKKMIEEAGVVLNSGIPFGSRGDQHMRLNVACPRSILETALQRIAQVF
jgi:cystathionine beta-lyase